MNRFGFGKQRQKRDRVYRPPSSPAGVVYLLREVDLQGQPTGLYKIGKSKRSGEHRIDEYQAGNARKLEVVIQVQSENCSKLESQLQRKFEKNRMGNGGVEWFYFPDPRIPVGEMIEQNASTLPPFAPGTHPYRQQVQTVRPIKVQRQTGRKNPLRMRSRSSLENTNALAEFLLGAGVGLIVLMFIYWVLDILR